MSISSRGIIYIATGKEFTDEACHAATRVKECMPAISITIFSDRPVCSPIFDQVIPIELPYGGPEDKILHIARSPYEETLYLDSDTHIVRDIHELFFLLRKFDIAAAHSPYRAQYHLENVPDCFPEFNAGVLLFRRSTQIQSLFRRWSELYSEDQGKHVDWLFPGGKSLYQKALPNQPSFRRALYESGLRIAPLTPEYNCRIPFPGYLHTDVKIIHGRVKSFTEISQALNNTLLPRVHVMRWGKLKIFDNAMPAEKNFLSRTKWSLHNHGIIRTVATMLKKCWGLFT